MQDHSCRVGNATMQEKPVQAAAPRPFTTDYSMSIQQNAIRHYQTVTACDDSSVEINGILHTRSLLVLPEVAPIAWPVASFDMLTAEHFVQIAALEPDVVLLGTGLRQRFIRPELTAALNSCHIGVECMDNRAACRTYCLLQSEGRKVALALIFNPSANDFARV